ncbi:MAG TPA: hypothetical protein VGE74_24015 [Gemmata sp.]
MPFARSRLLAPQRPCVSPSGRAPVRSAVARSRLALGAGAGLFLALSVALGVSVETVKPEWRDPEYGHRLNRVREWQAERPERPLVLVFGSSRAQMGVSPAAMGFPDAPGEPLVYNFGYRAGSPLVSWFLLARALDDGVKPRAVLLVASFSEARVSMTAEEQFRPWMTRLSGADLRRLAPFAADPGALREGVWGARRNPLAAHWGALASDLRCPIQDGEAVERWSWEKMDAHGFVRFPVESLGARERESLVAKALAQVAATDGAPGAVSDRAIRALVARCRAERIAVAVTWSPEAPWLRERYTANAQEGMAAYTLMLRDELGVPVFPAPGHLEGADFVDGYHLAPNGATKYSRWLADTYLRPWLSGIQ